jgi:hypothetical protein
VRGAYHFRTSVKIVIGTKSHIKSILLEIENVFFENGRALSVGGEERIPRGEGQKKAGWFAHPA